MKESRKIKEKIIRSNLPAHISALDDGAHFSQTICEIFLKSQG